MQVIFVSIKIVSKNVNIIFIHLGGLHSSQSLDFLDDFHQIQDFRKYCCWPGLLLATAGSSYLFVQKFPFKIHRSNFVFGVSSTPFLCAENCVNSCEIISPNKSSASFLSLEDAGCVFTAKAFPILCKTNNSACWTVSNFFWSCYCLNLFYHQILWYKLG